MKKTTMNFKEIKKLWSSQPFLEKLLFLMNKIKVSEDEATKLAKLEFEQIDDSYKFQIYKVLN